MKSNSSKKDLLSGDSQIALNESSVKKFKHRKRNKKLKKSFSQASEVEINNVPVVVEEKKNRAAIIKSSESTSPGENDFIGRNVPKKKKKSKKERIELDGNKTQSGVDVALNGEIESFKSGDILQKKGNKKKMKKKYNDLNTINGDMGKTAIDEKKSEIISDDETKSKNSEFDWDSYPSDTDEEVSGFGHKENFADYSSDESSSTSSDIESDHSFDAESYPSDSEDEDEKKKNFPKKSIPSAELEEKEKRTVFVGNLPKSVDRNHLKKWFFKFGKVECVRLRSAPIADPQLPRKVAIIKKTFHEDRSNIHAYVRFKTIEAAKNALQANGAVFQDHVIRVDSSIHEGKYDSNKAVFIGNVPFTLEENALRNLFLDCGDIDSVRIIRDKNTGVGKGFAYVNFKCSTSVPLALKLDGEILEKRELRVKPIKYQKKNVKTLLKRPVPQYHSKKFYNKPKANMAKKEKFQGEFSQKKFKKNPKKKTAEDRKREKFSKILSSKNKKSV